MRTLKRMEKAEVETLVWGGLSRSLQCWSLIQFLLKSFCCHRLTEKKLFGSLFSVRQYHIVLGHWVRICKISRKGRVPNKV